MIVFDEKRYAEKMLKNGYLTRHKNVYELSILAKYYFAEGMTREDVKAGLVDFCKKFDLHFNMDEWYKIINNTVKYATNSKLITEKEVHITQNELNSIKGLEKIIEQKVAFALLVLHKFYDYKKFEVSIEDLFRLSKLNLNSKTKLEVLQSLTSKDMIDINMGGKRWVKFADKKGITSIVIRDFDDFIYEYLKYIGEEGFLGCKLCEKAIKQTSNRREYCRECGDKKERDRKLILWHKNKHKYNTSELDNR